MHHNQHPGTAPGVLAAVLAIHEAMHPLCDHVVQRSADAMAKGRGGPDASAAERRAARAACVRHVASYSIVQVAALTAVTRALGVRLPWSAITAGTAVNAVTHYVIDLRWPLRKIMAWCGKAGYLEHAVVTRRGGLVEDTGPGTALYECDQATHRACSVLAAVVTALIATKER